MKRLVIDLDDTVCAASSFAPSGAPSEWRYANAVPNMAIIERLRSYKELGFTVVIHTSRNMRTFEGNVGLINVHTLPGILTWLNQHNVPYDEVLVGKPWCGTDGFYVDDRALRPSEFIALSHAEIAELLNKEKTRG
jgi:capsule biosynthesis phosphatase